MASNTYNDLTPAHVLPGSGKKVWWCCRHNPSHEWRTTVSSRSSGNGCPVCAGQVATAETCLQTKYPDLAAEWHSTANAPLTPDQILPGSGLFMTWRCSTDPSHVWQARVQHRVHGSGCPNCRESVGSSLEELFASLLEEYNIPYERQKVVGYRRVDFYLPNNNTILKFKGAFGMVVFSAVTTKSGTRTNEGKTGSASPTCVTKDIV